MIAIENFTAETSIEVGANGKTERVPCRVVGITNNDEGGFDFIVVTNEDGYVWVAQRDFVSAPDGKSHWPS